MLPLPESKRRTHGIDKRFDQYLEGGILYLGFTGLSVTDFKRLLMKLKTGRKRSHCRRQATRKQAINRHTDVVNRLSSANKIWKLNVAGNRCLGDEGMNHLDLIPPTVTDLDISDCSISPSGIGRLCSFLNHNKVIKRLVLWGNKIGDEGAKHIAKMLEVNQTLTDLSIMQCAIGPAGMLEISRGLASNSSLRSLSLYDRSMSEAHVWAISCFLSENRGLEYLDMWTAPLLCKAAVESLAKTLQENVALKRWKLGYEYPEISYWLKLNRLGRDVLAQNEATDGDWLDAFANSCQEGDLDAAFYFLRNRPELCDTRSDIPFPPSGCSRACKTMTNESDWDLMRKYNALMTPPPPTCLPRTPSCRSSTMREKRKRDDMEAPFAAVASCQ